MSCSSELGIIFDAMVRKVVLACMACHLIVTNLHLPRCERGCRPSGLSMHERLFAKALVMLRV